MRVFFGGDFARPSFETHGPHLSNIKWLFGLFERLVRNAGGEPVSLEACLPKMSYEQLHKEIYGDLDQEGRLHAWAEQIDKPIDIAGILDPARGDLFVGFELSTGMLRGLDAAGCAYLNLRLHPIRMLSDLVLTCESNRPELTCRIEAYRRDWTDIDPEVSRLTAFMRRKSTSFHSDCSIFIAQTRYDASVIYDGRFITAGDILSRIKGSLDERPMFIASHPYDRENPIVGILQKELGAQILPCDGLYEVLACARGDVAFVTYSSGGGREAQEFGHEVRFLSDQNLGKNSNADRALIPLSELIFRSEAWRHILFGTDPPERRPTSGVSILRASLNTKWAYPF